MGEPCSVRAGGGDVIRGAEPPVRAAGGHPESGQLSPQLPHQRRQERLVRRGPGPVGGALSLHPETRQVGPQPPARRSGAATRRGNPQQVTARSSAKTAEVNHGSRLLIGWEGSFSLGFTGAEPETVSMIHIQFLQAALVAI